MAPDLNSVPPSPRHPFHSPRASTSSSRRMSAVSQPRGAFTYGQNLPEVSRDTMPTQARSLSGLSTDNTGVGTGPGPLRHPRPLTAADLHLELEKEQEAVVNRLTRELSLLRQQSASVASTTSSTSTGHLDSTDPIATHTLFGASHPTPSRRHRSSSSLSTRSVSAATQGVGAIAPARDVPPALSHVRDSMSRQNSLTSSRPSRTSSPSRSSSLVHDSHFPDSLPHRQSSGAAHGYPTAAGFSVSHPTHQPLGPSTARSPTRGISSARYDEISHHRSELEAVKKENEALRRRIQDLESQISLSRR